ncbi:glutathione-disulfide reductase [Methylocella silvestris BL2]|uniref:Glutathione reductase n=1 Tax=Methylocella silvestris (strain DSM 15510 / CIP 108128 / LMG 27833 / NCIMB 13906 / BL2) TaxID=395965 RepID=B8ELA9_METSB|nr:glutathione-disulfide reductase [Methylocella silvestris]ACK49104.1 glutathione-disulfide reductase [Methylocella silvestris BL2]
MTDFDVDLFVIGAGSGGVRAARIAAGYGARVAIAEEFRVGGTCVIRGCVPKKLMVYASRFRDEFDDAAGFGWTIPETAFDWPKLVAAKEREISRLSAIYRANLEKAGVAMIDSRAEIEDPNSIVLADGRRLSAKIILVATGGTPVLEPEIPGRELAITSNEVFDLPVMPPRLLIVGAGYISVEFASIFTRLGSKVAIASRGENVLRGFDDDMRCGVRDALVEEGVEMHFSHLPTRIEKIDGGLRVHLTSGLQLDVDQVMMATGRRPHTKGLGLERAGVKLDGVGAVIVDHFSQSNVKSIYAVGDVTNRIQLTPIAIREGHAFADTVFGDKPTAVDHAHVPTAVFTTPELGAVGLTEVEAREVCDCVDIYQASFRPLKATLSGRTEKTMMKIVVDGRSDVVLGVHILGEGAAELAQVLAIAIRLGAKKADFDATIAVHPTSAEELVTMRARTARFERATAGPEAPDAVDAEFLNG